MRPSPVTATSARTGDLGLSGILPRSALLRPGTLLFVPIAAAASNGHGATVEGSRGLQPTDAGNREPCRGWRLNRKKPVAASSRTPTLKNSAVSMQSRMPRGPQRHDEHRAKRKPASAPRSHQSVNQSLPANSWFSLYYNSAKSSRAAKILPWHFRPGLNPSPSHSPAPISPAQLGGAHERLRSAPPARSCVPLRVRSADTGHGALEVSTAPLPLHALRPGTGRAPPYPTSIS